MEEPFTAPAIPTIPAPDPLVETTDRSAIESARWTSGISRGDEAAFSAFYACWFAPVQAQAKRLLRSEAHAVPDVVQDVMLRVARRIPALADERAVRAWMARTVFTVAMDWIRKDRRRRARERKAASQPQDHVQDTSVDAEQREQLQWLRAELLLLSAEDRQLIAARFAGDSTFQELGEEFAMTGHAVAGKIRRALTKLRERAESWLDG